MINQAILFAQKQYRQARLLKVLEFCLPISALIIVCILSFNSYTMIPIEQPTILMLGSFFLLLPIKSEATTTLQKIVGFYLFCVIVNESSLHYFSLFFAQIGVSYSVIVIMLCGTGYVIGKFNPGEMQQNNNEKDIIFGWILALSIVIIHIIFLSLVLSHFYGYGYERNLGVLGQLCLYFMLFIILFNKFAVLRFRQLTGLILGLHYLALIIKNYVL